MTEIRLYPGSGKDERTSFAPYSAFDIPADLRQLHGRFDVESVALRVRNWRYAEEWVMMILGGWVATIPELPVKTGLGKIIWDGALAADALGKRLPELRCGSRVGQQGSQAANQDFAGFIQEISAPERPDQSIEKLAGVFDVLKPHLIRVYEKFNSETDQICDAPTIELLEDIVRKTRKHVAWGNTILGELCKTNVQKDRRAARIAQLTAQLAACGGVTGEEALVSH
ncbi:MAG: hypothetical protein ABL951_12435 [Alphaproteobacteria bacterium]